MLPRAALRACLPVQCWRFCVPAGLPRRSTGVRRAWPQIWHVRAAGRVAAQLRPRSATANVRRRIWLATCAKLSMRTTAMDLTRHWRPGMAQRTRRVDSTVLAAPAIASGRLASRLRPGRKAARRVAACRRHRPRSARLHCKSITMCVPGRARVRLPALSLLPGMP